MKTSRTNGKRVVALAKMKNWVGGVRIVRSGKSWWVRERKRRQSNVWTRKKVKYENCRWRGFDMEKGWEQARQIRERGSVGQDQSQFAAINFFPPKLFGDLIARFRGNWYVAPFQFPNSTL